MILTIYYMAATLIHSWRRSGIFNKILKHISNKSSIVFYQLPKDFYDHPPGPASSELCRNQKEGRIIDSFWCRDLQRGCLVEPGQIINIDPWITFPKPPHSIPINVQDNSEETRPDQTIFVLVEAKAFPEGISIDQGKLRFDNNSDGDCDEFKTRNWVAIEEVGDPIAWKIDSDFAFLLRCNLDALVQFILSTFVEGNLRTINDGLPLIRIQTVQVEGEPQPFDLIKNHTKKDTFIRDAGDNLNREKREKYLQGLNSLSVLAQQAVDFNLERNRQEKPDLISSNCVKTPEIERIRTPKISPIKLTPISPIAGPSKPDITPKHEVEIIKKLSLEEPKLEKIEIKKVEEKPQNTIELKVKPSSSKSSSKDPPIPSEPVSKKKPLKRAKNSQGSYIGVGKPPNILVYSESGMTRDNTIAALKSVLKKDFYTIYPLNTTEIKNKIWQENTQLLVICGPVNSQVSSLLLEFYLNLGGKMLCLCSDLLHIFLPNYRTAEVREQELAQFSYNRWQKVNMMHHIFCYQPSPVKKHFSHDSEDNGHHVPKQPALICPRSVDVKDTLGKQHTVDVQILGVEETWQTPSILLAINKENNGRAIFSQVHLESDPNQFESDEAKFTVLKSSNQARLEILGDILSSHLNIIVVNESPTIPSFTCGFFLGRHDLKNNLLDTLSPKMEPGKLLRNSKMALKFVAKEETPPKATEALLPIYIHACPEDFNTVIYFEQLKTDQMGRLVFYIPVVTSSMDVLDKITLDHGVVVIPKYQTNGVGRNKNQWLSPEGCIMFTMQLKFSLNSPLGQRVPLIQHLFAVAIVNAVGHQDILDLRIKWPNDIYANGTIKVGGLICNSILESNQVICNVGVGLNLYNEFPTVSINDLIRNANKELPIFQAEEMFAKIFNEAEKLFNHIQEDSKNFKSFYEQYYQNWLHQDQEIEIEDQNGVRNRGTILGIDEYGYLLVRVAGGDIQSVHPNGNSFDMLRGLIFQCEKN